MKYKILIGILSVVYLSFLVSAVPQVIFSEINLTIQNGSFRLLGEGIDATDTFVCGGNCDINYSRNNIPITISRNICEDTDFAVLINALASNQNMTDKWEECVNHVGLLNNNLSSCDLESGYEGNYTNCKSQLGSCDTGKDGLQEDIKRKNEEIKSLKTSRMIFVGLTVICVLFAVNLYRKSNVKTTNTPGFRGLPINAKV